MTSPNKDPRSGSQINSATSYVKRKYPKDYLNHVAEYTEKEMNESVLRCFCGADAELEAGGDDGSCRNFCYNIYICPDCSTIYKQDIARREIVVLYSDNRIERKGYEI